MRGEWEAYVVEGLHVGGMHALVGGHAWQGVCVAGEIATAVDGTHPTGMHILFSRCRYV